MPSFDHEVVVRLFQNNPELAPELLRGVFGMELPDYRTAQIGCADLTDLKPRSYKADDVVVLRGSDDTNLMAIIAEPQLQKDDEKPFTWPLYVCEVRARLLCPVRLLVLCPDEKTAAWARQPIVVEPGPNPMVQYPKALGPRNTPVIDDPERARRLPELSVLSAAAHGDDAAVLQAAQAGLDTVTERALLVYNDYIEAKLSAAARQFWEELMATGTYEWQSDFARKYVAEGEARGEARGEAKAIVAVLAERGITLSEDQRERILTCTDLDRLGTWLRRAITATTAKDLFT